MSEKFFYFWQNLPSQIDPEIISFSFFSIKWYSFGYLLASLTVLVLIFWRIEKKETRFFSLRNKKTGKHSNKGMKEQFVDIFLVVIFGLILGARIGYGFFYEFDLILKPWQLLSPFKEGSYIGIYGLSFHGGLIGIFLALLIYSKIKKINLWSWLNFIVPAVPLGYFWGRMGNFFNSELFGRTTEKKFGMYFPIAGEELLRHPSQLYEAFFEGIVIFIILWPLRNRNKYRNKMFPLFLILYGVTRFLIEFVREEEFFGIFTKGQYLSLGMVIIGMILIWLNPKKN